MTWNIYPFPSLERERERDSNKLKGIGGCAQTEIALKNLHVAAFSPEARKNLQGALLSLFFLTRVDSCRQDKFRGLRKDEK